MSIKIITLISTVHSENGKCNANELCSIIYKLSPEVIFLEALPETYSKYQKSMFSSFGVFHKKLEIEAIQKYQLDNSSTYIPVLDNGLSEFFDRKYEIICENIEHQNMVYHFNNCARDEGFTFLNSKKGLELQEKIREFENVLLGESEINNMAIRDIDHYENSMLRNIYKYCIESDFKEAVFMCGVAHRKSIIKKIENNKTINGTQINWKVWGYF